MRMRIFLAVTLLDFMSCLFHKTQLAKKWFHGCLPLRAAITEDASFQVITAIVTAIWHLFRSFQAAILEHVRLA